MANAQYTIANGDRTDANAFSVPGDEDGGVGDDSFQVEPEPLGKSRRWYVHIENGWDQNADVTVQGSNYLDESMDAPVDDGASETISSSENGAFDGETGHTYLQVSVDPASTPTSGNLVVTFQSREE